jgi:hypothetical protein
MVPIVNGLNGQAVWGIVTVGTSPGHDSAITQRRHSVVDLVRREAWASLMKLRVVSRTPVQVRC